MVYDATHEDEYSTYARNSFLYSKIFYFSSEATVVAMKEKL